jgi:hypothetical protein
MSPLGHKRTLLEGGYGAALLAVAPHIVELALNHRSGTCRGVDGNLSGTASRMKCEKLSSYRADALAAHEPIAGIDGPYGSCLSGCLELRQLLAHMLSQIAAHSDHARIVLVQHFVFLQTRSEPSEDFAVLF